MLHFILKVTLLPCKIYLQITSNCLVFKTRNFKFKTVIVYNAGPQPLHGSIQGYLALSLCVLCSFSLLCLESPSLTDGFITNDQMVPSCWPSKVFVGAGVDLCEVLENKAPVAFNCWGSRSCMVPCSPQVSVYHQLIF